MNKRVTLLPSLVLLLVAGGCASRAAPSVTPAMPAEPADFETQLAEYVEVQEALAADSFEQAKTQLEEFALISDSATQALALRALEASDIEEMRVGFKPLSESLAAQDLPQGYARAYCPMYDNGSSWVQRDGPVRNPFYGAVMLSCGVVDAAAGAHMDHGPKHGGTVFMAPDSFHHIEGTYPEPGVFRLYATDNYREPVDVSTWTGRAVTEEAYDEKSDEFIEVAAFDLFASPDGAFLEALIPQGTVPAEVTAKVIFEEDFPAERFDFIFAELTVEDAPTAATVGDAPEAVPLAQRILPDIPDDAGQIAAEITIRSQQIAEMIGRGAFTEIFIPALQAKELALALQGHGSELPVSDRNQVRIAVRHLVRAAYLLDWYGDLGNKNDVDSAYGVFGTAVVTIGTIYDTAGAP
ncbi:MAG: hypothetical protein QF681_08490 [Vicinamibacterales bacterium]|jgi:hypothetical protein|nr:hypothetical protein [Vicinamibacterales bacterium]